VFTLVETLTGTLYNVQHFYHPKVSGPFLVLESLSKQIVDLTQKVKFTIIHTPA